ncbi:Mu transposase domain-containing protein [Micromonospora sediminicola]|uniref:Mu transposase domain-containing protein n=1 Tax=Micromonospora sediminicola TaxID=946078 RepID=UPI003F4D1E33
MAEWRLPTRLPRDHYVRLDANDYSVHPTTIGRRVEVIADSDQADVCCEGRQVAHHDRCWQAGRPSPTRSIGRQPISCWPPAVWPRSRLSPLMSNTRL